MGSSICTLGSPICTPASAPHDKIVFKLTVDTTKLLPSNPAGFALEELTKSCNRTGWTLSPTAKSKGITKEPPMHVQFLDTDAAELRASHVILRFRHGAVKPGEDDLRDFTLKHRDEGVPTMASLKALDCASVPCKSSMKIQHCTGKDGPDYGVYASFKNKKSKLHCNDLLDFMRKSGISIQDGAPVSGTGAQFIEIFPVLEEYLAPDVRISNHGLVIQQDEWVLGKHTATSESGKVKFEPSLILWSDAAQPYNGAFCGELTWDTKSDEDELQKELFDDLMDGLGDLLSNDNKTAAAYKQMQWHMADFDGKD